ncbi:MAG: amidohydrolase family protein [Lachnospiraceae bacterium]|jgi:cytosine/adenosine deaminase-related metal-dependent hydrolase|nr:amidohydrolase family protein [Lachnospiraceae bacterium]
MSNTVIKAGLLLTPDGLIEQTGVVISKERIELIDNNETLPIQEGDFVYDFRDRLLAPGFINGHTHLYGMYSHGINAAPPKEGFSSFLDDFWWPEVENRMDHELLKAATAYSMCELIDSGVTTIVDVIEAPNAIPGALEAECEVIEKAGLRAVLTFEASQRMNPENAEAGLLENADFVRKHNSKDGLVRAMMSIHTLFTCDESFIRKAKQLSKELCCDFHMHLSESVFEPRWSMEKYGSLPVEVYEKFGVLDERVLASQCVNLNEKEKDILAQNGVRAVHMPLSNCEVGGGIADVTGLLQRGMSVGIGSDGYINNHFEIMRGAFLIPKAHWQSTSIMPAKTVYEMATSLGAKAAGMPEMGQISKGCMADLITIDLDTPTPVNSHNVYDQLVLFRNPENVCDVMVGGRFIKKNHELLTVSKDAAKEKLRFLTDRFWKK